mgnify:CR=1 FL=1
MIKRLITKIKIFFLLRRKNRAILNITKPEAELTVSEKVELERQEMDRITAKWNEYCGS